MIKSPKIYTLLWFGNYGAPHAKFGICDLLGIQGDLEKIAEEYSIELLVVSNNKEVYKKNIKQFEIPTRYVEWSEKAMGEAFSKADIVLIPNSLDDFSRCKSANRTVLAILNNVPVVATLTPALAELSKWIQVDDFYVGIKSYLKDPELGRNHVENGKKLALELYSKEVIAEKWDKLITGRPIEELNAKISKYIIVISLIQDLDLAVPIIEEAISRGIELEAWVNGGLFKKTKRAQELCREFRIKVLVLPEKITNSPPIYFPNNVKALVAITESNLGPHRFSRKLTEAAQKAGISTATLQHGFENIGITYSDDIHNIRKISFISDRIYIWGPAENLHPGVTSENRDKCISVGCPKPVRPKQVDLQSILSGQEKIVGIFENLHWHRYNDQYRNFFIEGVKRVAETNKHILFLIKPHPAGLWYTAKNPDGRQWPLNLKVFDHHNPELENISAPQMFGCLDAVLTTPGTVALDAARFGIPVAVIKHELDLEIYEPLPMVSEISDWQIFIDQAVNIRDKEGLKSRMTAFVERNVIEGNAARQILDNVLKQSELN